MNHYGVIMAGGGGTRFWPLSREKKPKQFINLTGNDAMVNEAIDRMTKVITPDHIFIVTSESQATMMAKVTSSRISSSNIISEPAARNTAACIGLSAITLLKKHGDGVILITPSDHYIRDVSALCKSFFSAINKAEETDKIVTIGLEPTFPSTGYGYIKYDKSTKDDIKPVIEFREKPDEKKAQSYIDSGEYLWNSGMFIWKASVVLDRLKEFAPDIYDILMRIGDAINTPEENDVLHALYPTIRSISIDYAVMEPSASQGEVVVIPTECKWNDVGSWDMMEVLHDVDANGNIILGDAVPVDVKNSIIYSSHRTVTAVGVEGLVIVETPDSIMICRKDNAQDVKKIVEKLKKEGRKELL